MSRSVSSGAETKKFFARIKHQGHPNHTCIDCNRKNAQWASVSYGTFICIECSGTHRSLGVHLSFVRSVTMDSWTKIQLQTMEAGGNARFRAFLEANQFPEGISVANKYNSTAAKAYREWLKAEVRGEDPPEIPFMGYKNDSGFGRSSGGGNYTSASSSSSSSSSKSSRGNKKGYAHVVACGFACMCVYVYVFPSHFHSHFHPQQ
jgi:ADP-ribosylation factor GTPase-activating protein 1